MPQTQQFIARLSEFVSQGAAQPLRGFAEARAQPVALLRQARVQIVQHRPVLLFQPLPQARGHVLHLAGERGYAPGEPGSEQKQQNGKSNQEFKHE